MTRIGIYVNGKEIVARYVGDKLVWRKNKWVLVKYFSLGPNNYENDYSTYTTVTAKTSQYMGGYPPELSPSERYPTISQSLPGEYKIKFPFIDSQHPELEFILDSVTISNRQNRRQNYLSILFKFKTSGDRDMFMSRKTFGSHFELYRKG